MADADRIAAALLYQQQLDDALTAPVTANTKLLTQGVKARANMTPPVSVMAPGHDEWRRNMDDAEKFMLATDVASNLIPFAGPAAKGAIAVGKSMGKYAGPEIAKGLENYMVNSGLRPSILNTEGLPNQGRELIQNKASELSDTLKAQGFDVDLQHSGSLAGPSSYVKVSDPQTGRYITDPARFSGHGKGPFQSQFVHEMTDDPKSMQKFVDMAMEMRAKGPSESMINQIANQQAQFEKQQSLMQMRYKKAQEKLLKGESLSNSERKAIDLLEKQKENK